MWAAKSILVGNRAFPLHHQYFFEYCLHSFDEHKSMRDGICNGFANNTK